MNKVQTVATGEAIHIGKPRALFNIHTTVKDTGMLKDIANA
jgi:hypothetical protein